MSSHRVSRLLTVGFSILCALVYACTFEDDDETSTAEQAGSNVQGTNLQGSNVQGTSLQGMRLQGFRFAGATKDGAALTNLHVDKGELVAEQNGATLRGTTFAGVQLVAEAINEQVSPPTITTVPFRITAVAAESSAYDPTHTGSTYLYTIEQWVSDTSSWQPACPADADGRRVAIPVAATWDAKGNRVESTALFTLGCTTGVIAKCYRWGYRPWLTGYGADMAEMHWTCTRLARADYCGNGVSNTHDGTLINNWDNLPAPGPIQSHGITPLFMLFEAGWSTRGAVCLSHARWLTIGNLIANMCPDRLIPLSLGGIGCDSVLDVLDIDPTVRMFDESYVNLGL